MVLYGGMCNGSVVHMHVEGMYRYRSGGEIT